MTHPINIVTKPFCKTVRLMKKISASYYVTSEEGARDNELKRKTDKK